MNTASEPLLSSKIFQAQAFALTAHNFQVRRDGVTPYAAHLYDVAQILLKSGADENTLSAEWLHDIVEGTDISLPQLRSIFGNGVTDIVDLLSERDNYPGVPRPSKIRQKLRYIKRLKNAPLYLRRSARLISCADKLSEARDFLHEHRCGRPVSEQDARFTMYFYSSLMPLFNESLPGMRAYKEMELAYLDLCDIWPE